MHVALTGSTGFVGHAVAAGLRDAGLTPRAVVVPRLSMSEDADVAAFVESWIRHNRSDFLLMAREFAGAEVVVHAAGLAVPSADASPELFGANSALPLLIARGAWEMGVSRVIHVGSAAVQGHMDPLDESTATSPLTPYARSKARAESALLDCDVHCPSEMIIYRPTSIQAAERQITRQLVRVAQLPVLPVCENGDVPLPVTTRGGVARAVVHLVTTPSCPRIALHPWEGMTTRKLMAAFGSARLLSIPRSLATHALHAVYTRMESRSRVIAGARRLELLVLGQRQEAQAFRETGFLPPSDPHAYQVMAAAIRAEKARRR